MEVIQIARQCCGAEQDYKRAGTNPYAKYGSFRGFIGRSKGNIPRSNCNSHRFTWLGIGNGTVSDWRCYDEA